MSCHRLDSIRLDFGPAGSTIMPSIKAKTHKGIKKRFKVTGTGKVIHKRCGSSHLNSHKSGKKIRQLRRKSVITVNAVAQKLRRYLRTREVITPGRGKAAAEPATPTTESSES